MNIATINVTEPMIIKHLLPAHDPDSGVIVEPYCEVVTQDDFDEEDNWAPGTYTGVRVDSKTADVWSSGIAACKMTDVHTRSPEGIALRYRAMHGDVKPPTELTDWAEQIWIDKAKKDQQRAEQEAQWAAELASYEAILEGYTSIGADEYSGQWWSLAKRAELELLGEWQEPERFECQRRRWRRAYRLPNGDILQCTNESWTRYTKDAALIHTAATRKGITANRYEPQLFDALVALEKNGALTLACGSWFGGFPVPSNPVRAFAGVHNATGPETVIRLRQHLGKCAKAHPRHAAAIAAALGLVIDESIVAE